MATYEIYGTSNCIFCDKAKDLLGEYNLDYAFIDVADVTWASATIPEARGALIYNYTFANAGTAGDTTHAAKPSVCVINFGADSSSSAGNFTVTMPANDANNALIRIA